MATQLCFKAPSIELKNLNNLWIQITGVTCNLKCRHCYLSCSPTNKTRAFLTLDKIKNHLEDAKKHNIKEIYLHGGEPLLHPDLNNIIRLTLKHTNVTILTNGTLINDKKARFLRQIEQDHDYELIFRVSMDHYLEEKNDEIRGKGTFKKTFAGIENLVRYGFNPIITTVNIWNEEPDSLKEGFKNIFQKIHFEPGDINFKIIPPVKLGEYATFYEKYSENDLVTNADLDSVDPTKFDCSSSRIITDNGVYVCPILVSDPRGKLGNTISDSSKRFFLETGACYTCVKNNISILNNNWAN